MAPRSRFTLCLLLVLAVTFAGLAVFSPLHKHDQQSPTKCSLNNLDAQQTDGPVAVLTLPCLARVGVPDPLPALVLVVHEVAYQRPSRAPPVVA